MSNVAVRSSDANHVALHLVSPIAMERLGLYCNYKTYDKDNELAHSLYNYLELCLDDIWQYLGGDRDGKLESATLNLFKAITLEKKGQFLNFKSRNGQGLIPIEGILAVAAAYKEGEIKYCKFNCELGFPIDDLLNHCLLHIYKFFKGDTTEDQLGHAGWGLFMAMHSEIKWPELNKGTLRTGNCDLSEDIRNRIKETMEKKKL